MPDVEALKRKLALAERECPENFPGNHPQSCVCHGTDIAPLLDGVRVKCPCLESVELQCYFCSYNPTTGDLYHNSADCSVCQGRGWVPGEDWTWFGVVRQCAIDAKTSGNPYLFSKLSAILGNVWAGKQAFYSALAKALNMS